MIIYFNFYLVDFFSQNVFLFSFFVTLLFCLNGEFDNPFLLAYGVIYYVTQTARFPKLPMNPLGGLLIVAMSTSVCSVH